jgi:uncharacterized protein
MNLQDEAIDIAVGGQHIAGTLQRPAGERSALPGVLMVHGWGGNQQQYLPSARAIAALGCVCLTFDLRGHAATGPQHETVTRDDNLQDVAAAYDVLANHRAVDRSFVALVGASYGGYLGAILTLLRPLRLLALRAPALYRDADWEMPKRKLHVDPDFAAYRRRTLLPTDNRALGACAQFRGDALVVESELDEVIPHPAVANYVAALANAHSLTYRVIEGADHALSLEPWERAYSELLVAWLKEMTAAATGG